MAGVQIKPAVSHAWVRFLAALGVVAMLVAAYIYFFGVQTGATLLARYKYRGIPAAMQTPVPLKDLSVSSIPHRKLSWLGYELELPWDDVDESKSKTGGRIHLTAFRSGNVFWFSCFPPDEFVKGVMKDTKVDPETFRRTYGDKASQSDYEFIRMMLAVTPRTITPFTSTQQSVRDSTLLLLKAMAVPEAASGIFSIGVAGRKGYQFGDPGKDPQEVRDDLYGSDDGVELAFFLKPHGSVPAISQAEINRVLQSLHKVSDPATDASR